MKNIFLSNGYVFHLMLLFAPAIIPCMGPNNYEPVMLPEIPHTDGHVEKLYSPNNNLYAVLTNEGKQIEVYDICGDAVWKKHSVMLLPGWVDFSNVSFSLDGKKLIIPAMEGGKLVYYIRHIVSMRTEIISPVDNQTLFVDVYGNYYACVQSCLMDIYAVHATGNKRLTFRIHTLNPIIAAAFSPDAHHCIILTRAANGESALVWYRINLPECKYMGSATVNANTVSAVIFSPNSKHCVVSTDQEIVKINLAQHPFHLERLQTGLSPYKIHFSPGSDYLLFQHCDNSINIYNLQNHQERKITGEVGESTLCHSLQFSNDGNILFRLMDDRVEFLELSTGMKVTELLCNKVDPIQRIVCQAGSLFCLTKTKTIIFDFKKRVFQLYYRALSQYLHKAASDQAKSMVSNDQQSGPVAHVIELTPTVSNKRKERE